jgi:hypothetical protein
MLHRGLVLVMLPVVVLASLGVRKCIGRFARKRRRGGCRHTQERWRTERKHALQFCHVGRDDGGTFSVTVKVWRAPEREYVELAFSADGWVSEETYDLTHQQVDRLIEALKNRPRSTAEGSAG